MIRSVSIAKRAIDIVSSALGLIVTLPLFPLLAVAIYLAVCAAISVLATLGLRDNRARDITREYDEEPVPASAGAVSEA